MVRDAEHKLIPVMTRDEERELIIQESQGLRCGVLVQGPRCGHKPMTSHEMVRNAV